MWKPWNTCNQFFFVFNSSKRERGHDYEWPFKYIITSWCSSKLTYKQITKSIKFICFYLTLTHKKQKMCPHGNLHGWIANCKHIGHSMSGRLSKWKKLYSSIPFQNNTKDFFHLNLKFTHSSHLCQPFLLDCSIHLLNLMWSLLLPFIYLFAKITNEKYCAMMNVYLDPFTTNAK